MCLCLLLPFLSSGGHDDVGSFTSQGSLFYISVDALKTAKNITMQIQSGSRLFVQFYNKTTIVAWVCANFQSVSMWNADTVSARTSL